MKWIVSAAVLLIAFLVWLFLRFFYAGMPYEEWVELEKNRKEE